jgi:carbon monoxide dehydrogenase subunit G
MDLTGDYRIPAPREAVWAALNDPEVLRACIPHCEELAKNSDTEFVAKVVVKIGPVKASFGGKVTLSDIDAPNGYTISGEGQGGAAGFAKGGAKVRLESVDGGAATILHYVADAQIGGKLAQIGSRLVEGSAKKLADEFFAAFAAQAAAKAGGIPAEAAATVPSPEAVPVVAAQEPAIATASEPAPAQPEQAGRGLSPWVWIGGLTVVVGAILAAVAATR